MGACYSDKSHPISGDLSDSSSSGGMPVTGSDRAIRPKSGLPRPKSIVGQSKSGQNEKKTGIAKLAVPGAKEGKMGSTQSKPGLKGKGSGITGPDTRTKKSASCTSLNNNDAPCAVAQIVGDDVRMIDDESDIVNANTQNSSARGSPRRGSRTSNGSKSGASPRAQSHGRIPAPKQGSHVKSPEKNQLKKPQMYNRGHDAIRHSPKEKGGRNSHIEVGKSGIAVATSQIETEKDNTKGIRVFKGLRFGGGNKKAKNIQNEQVQENKHANVKKDLPKSEIVAPLASMDSVSLSSYNKTPNASLLPSPADESVPLPSINTSIVHNVSASNTQFEIDTTDGAMFSSTPLKKSKPKTGVDLNSTYTADESVSDDTYKDKIEDSMTRKRSSVQSHNVTFDMNKTAVLTEQLDRIHVSEPKLVSEVFTNQGAAPNSTIKPKAILVNQPRLNSLECESLGSIHSDDLMLDLELDEFDDLPYEGSCCSGDVSRQAVRPRSFSKDSAEAVANIERRSRGGIARRFTEGALQKRFVPARRRTGSLREQAPLQELSSLVERQPVTKLRERGKSAAPRPNSYPGSMIARPRSISMDAPESQVQVNPAMFRQRHLLSFPDDAVIEVDAVSYRQMVQELTNMKTMLLKLKRNLQEDGLSSPFTPTAPKDFPQEPSVEEKSEKGAETKEEDMIHKNQELEHQIQKLQEQLQQQNRTIHLLQEQMTKWECNANTLETRDKCEAGIQTDLLVTQTDSGLASPDQNDHNSTFTISQVTDEDDLTQIEVPDIMAISGSSTDFIETDIQPDINKNPTPTKRSTLDNVKVNGTSSSKKRQLSGHNRDSTVGKVRNVRSRLAQPKHYEKNDNDNKRIQTGHKGLKKPEPVRGSENDKNDNDRNRGAHTPNRPVKGVKRGDPGRAGLINGLENRPVSQLPRSKLTKYTGLPRPAAVRK